MSEPKAIDVCTNPKCEWPIYKGDHVWKRGKDLFCHAKCLVEVMEEEKKMKLRFHVYVCEDCVAVFAVEDHEDLEHSEIVCPFCKSEDSILDLSHGEMEVDYEKRQEINQEAKNCSS